MDVPAVRRNAHWAKNPPAAQINGPHPVGEVLAERPVDPTSEPFGPPHGRTIIDTASSLRNRGNDRPLTMRATHKESKAYGQSCMSQKQCSQAELPPAPWGLAWQAH